MTALIYLTPCFPHFLFIFLVLFLYLFGLYLLLILFGDSLIQCGVLRSYGALGRSIFALGGEVAFSIGSRWVSLDVVCLCVVLVRLGSLGFAGIPVCVLGGGLVEG